MGAFSFGKKAAPKKAAKKASTKIVKNGVQPIPLTEEEVTEDNEALNKFLEATPIDPSKARFRRENELAKKKQNDQNEAHFYTCLVFQSWEQKMEFLSKIPKDILCTDDIFIDGEDFAEKMGIQLTPNTFPAFDTRTSSKLLERAKIPK